VSSTTLPPRPNMVPVVACPTGPPIGGTALPKYPRTLAVSLAPALAARLAFYTDSTRAVEPILAPRGWACNVSIGGDGMTTVIVYRSGTAGTYPAPFRASGAQAVSAHSDSACQGCIYNTVCPLVPLVREAFSSIYPTGFSCSETKPPIEEVRWISGSPTIPPTQTGINVVGFTDPPGVAGDGAPSGGRYIARGVLLFATNSSQGNAASFETCTLRVHESITRAV
jgi:hypothetical protein